MREILFRGKRKDNGEWIQGDFCSPCNIVFLEKGYDDVLKKDDCPVCNDYEVIPETVGQYTGLCDKNGKKIFEGDILSHYINWLGCRVNGVCEYDKEQAAWMCRFVDKNGNKLTGFLADWVDNNGCEIIGNIHDNPELMIGVTDDA